MFDLDMPLVFQACHVPRRDDREAACENRDGYQRHTQKAGAESQGSRPARSPHSHLESPPLLPRSTEGRQSSMITYPVSRMANGALTQSGHAANSGRPSHGRAPLMRPHASPAQSRLHEGEMK